MGAPSSNLPVQVWRLSEPEPADRFGFISKHAPAPWTLGSVQVRTWCSRFTNQTMDSLGVDVSGLLKKSLESCMGLRQVYQFICLYCSILNSWYKICGLQWVMVFQDGCSSQVWTSSHNTLSQQSLSLVCCCIANISSYSGLSGI